jgi:hypothetical protein
MIPRPALPQADFAAALPDGDRVLADIRAEDRIDTAARRVAALNVMRDAMQYATGTLEISRLPGAAGAKAKSYLEAERKAGTPAVDRNCQSADCPYQRWFNLQNTYYYSPEFREEVLSRYLPGHLVSAYVADYRSRMPGAAEQAAAASAAATRFADGMAVMAIGIWGVLFAAAVMSRLAGRMNVRLRDGGVLQVGRRTFALREISGIVHASTRDFVPKPVTLGGVNQQGAVQAPVERHQQFFIREGGGKEHPVQLVDVNFPVADGHSVSAIVASRTAGAAGVYAYLRNHSTGQVVFPAGGMKELTNAPGLPWLIILLSLPLLLIPLVVYYLISGGVAGKQAARIREVLTA